MKPKRWQEIERLFNSVLELEPERREPFLRQNSAGDESLRKEVAHLLEHQAEAEGYMESPALEVAARALHGERETNGMGASEGRSAADYESSKVRQIGHDSLPDDSKGQPRKHAPWWMYVLAGIFLICAAAHYYGFYVAPENSGIAYHPVTDKTGRVMGAVTGVVPASPAARMGLERGDLILNIGNSNPLYWQAGQVYRLEVKRKEETRAFFLRLNPLRVGHWFKGPGKTNLSIVLLSPWYLLLAAVVAFNRPYDTAARWGALFLAIAGIHLVSNILTPLGWYGTALRFPLLLGWICALLPTFIGATFISLGTTFFSVFPRRLFREPWFWMLIWLPAAIFAPRVIFSDHPPVYSFSRWWPDWYDNFNRILVVLGWGAMAGVLILNYLHLHDLNERRRVRIIVAGALTTLIAALPSFAVYLAPLSDFIRRIQSGISTDLRFVLACFLWAFPLSMAYAILRHRLFDIRLVIRLGLKYAAARGVLLSLVPIVAVVFAGDLLIHGDQPLMQILRQRGLLYAVLAGGGFLLHIRRKAWLDLLDRRFFREHYNAQRLLRSVIDEIREARDIEKVAPQVVSRLADALHPEFAALLMRRPGNAMYQVSAASGKAPSIRADGKLMAMVRVLAKPLEFSASQTGWPWNQLPHQEIDFLQQTRIEWLFPICLVEGQTEALIAVGPKRSEEPYSGEDQELLRGITSGLALLLEQSPLAAAAEGFEECPQCGTCCDSGAGSCKKDGTKLMPMHFSRLFARRYRLELRLGEGGMGTVYEAFDTELERHVAVKMIRPDQTENAETAARFKREAKAAASLMHRNVVTVYDFGMTEDRRAYLIMELLRGVTLRQDLSRRGCLPASRAADIFCGICAAVDAAHRKRLLHRDLKPENIFLVHTDGADIAKILDFGIAKPLVPANPDSNPDHTGPRLLLGTLKYMSPEQLRGEEATESWDLWALAVVAYEMLAGTHPFAGSNASDVQNAILAGRMIPLRTYLPQTPSVWQSFFDQAFSARLELRPASAMQLLSEFNRTFR